MNKKSTTFLTIIAITTLLVLLVGSTFAFFAIQETNTAKIDVTSTTAKSSDIFTATGTGLIVLNITNEKMLESSTKDAEGNDITVVADEDSNDSMLISLYAGSGKATCEYDLLWTESTGAEFDIYKKTPAAGANLEYTLSGISNRGNKIEETNLDSEIVNSKRVLGHFIIEDEYDENEVTTNEKWTFTAKFYNLPISQSAQTDKKYGGQITVENVSCKNNTTKTN